MKEINRYRVRPGRAVDWRRVDPDDRGGFAGKEDCQAATAAVIAKLDGLQERLYAEGKQSLLIVLQGMDSGGKDGTIRHVMSGINPQGCTVTSFKVPTPLEKAHDYLWRVHRAAPARGMIGIFNRSHYEEVLITRVHGQVNDQEARRRFRAIRNFEELLSENGTTVVKFFLAISRDEQRRRLQARIDDPGKHWKFSLDDVGERKFWDRYQEVYAEAISATSTKEAPWHIIPADHKWYRNHAVARIVVATLEAMHPRTPPDPPGVDFAKVRIPK